MWKFHTGPCLNTTMQRVLHSSQYGWLCSSKCCERCQDWGDKHFVKHFHLCTTGLTQRSSRSLLELSRFQGFLDGAEQCWHVLTKTAQAIGPTALHCLQISSVGVNGPLEHFLLSPEDRRRWVLSLCQRRFRCCWEDFLKKGTKRPGNTKFSTSSLTDRVSERRFFSYPRNQTCMCMINLSSVQFLFSYLIFPCSSLARPQARWYWSICWPRVEIWCVRSSSSACICSIRFVLAWLSAPVVWLMLGGLIF